MSRKSKVKIEPTVQERSVFDEAVLKAVRLGATSYTTVRDDVIKAQRILPEGPAEVWPREFEKSLMRLIKSGDVAVTNGNFWPRNVTVPKWGER